MVQNFGRDKRRIEELKKKRREEKQLKKLNKGSVEVPPASPTAPLPSPAEEGSAPSG